MEAAMAQEMISAGIWSDAPDSRRRARAHQSTPLERCTSTALLALLLTFLALALAAGTCHAALSVVPA